jgi:hypothetical protein
MRGHVHFPVGDRRRNILCAIPDIIARHILTAVPKHSVEICGIESKELAGGGRMIRIVEGNRSPRIPVPGAFPFEDSASAPLVCPPGSEAELCEDGVVWKKPFENENALRVSPRFQT